jgi:hypothetical protein
LIAVKDEIQACHQVMVFMQRLKRHDFEQQIIELAQVVSVVFDGRLIGTEDVSHLCLLALLIPYHSCFDDQGDSALTGMIIENLINDCNKNFDNF